MPKLSIIVPTFNSSASIDRCLRSLGSQTFRDYEVIVQDGGSSDDTLAKVQGFHNANDAIQLAVASQKDKGPYDGMNKGVARANGEWLYFLGSDDELYDCDVLGSVMELPDLAEANVVYGNAHVIGDSAWARLNPVYGGPFELDKLLKMNICHQALFYRATFFREVGFYNTDYLIYGDWDFNLRCWPRTEFKYLEKTIVHYNANGLSSSGRDDCFRRDVAANVLKYLQLSIYAPELNVPEFPGYYDILAMQKSERSLKSLLYRVRRRLRGIVNPSGTEHAKS